MMVSDIQKVGITRHAAGNEELKARLEKENMTVVTWDSFVYESLLDDAQEQALRDSLQGADWLVFTSQATVDFFCERFAAGDVNHLKIATVGERTAQSLKEKGHSVELVPQVKTAKGLAAEDAFQNSKNLQIVVPQAEDARSEFEKALKGSHDVQTFVCYRKIFQPIPKHFDVKTLQAILFFSPAVLHHFVEETPRAVNHLGAKVVGVIGRTTQEACEELGFQPKIVADSSTDDLVSKLVDFSF